MRKEDLSTPIKLTTILALAVSGCVRSASVSPIETEGTTVPNYDATTDSMRATLNAMETHLAELKTAQASTQVPTETLEPIATTTQEATATETPTPTATQEVISNGVEKFNIFEVEDNVNGWTIKWTDIAQKAIDGGKSFEQWAKAIYPEWPQVQPEKWPTAPNVPNPLVPEFRVVSMVNDKGETVQTVPDGVEIPDEGERDFCQVVEGESCTNVVAPGHYMLYTGDGEIPGLWKSEEGKGNALLIINVGNTDFRPTGTFLQGWRLTGRYFNGDTLPIAINALISHADNNMLNLESALNPNQGLPNAGANCSDRNGCNEVVNKVIIVSGGAPLLIAESEVGK